MPHFYLMNESKMAEKDAALLRARLHIRAFRTLMAHNRYAQGISTLYDALHQALRWFCLEHADELGNRDISQLWTQEIYRLVEQSGLVTLNFDIESFENILGRAMKPGFDDTAPAFDYEKLWTDMEQVFRALEVMPFDVKRLPAVNEATKKAMGLG